MRMNPLGRTGLTVSELCLGTMTYGNQTPPEDAHAQMDRALDAGINFLDTAEMYPVNPVSAETLGRSEEIIGDWLVRTGRRAEWIIATKHSGQGMEHARGGAPISAATIPQAIEESLRRLRCDYIDLYQFHWPNRGSYMFRKNWHFDPSSQNTGETLAHMEEALEALQRQVEKGNIRHFGLSNESAWGTLQWLRLAEAGHGPRVASVQNEYSLMCRLYDTDMAEVSHHEDVGLLAFSPLAAGFLTGKYQDGGVPGGSRKSLNPTMGGREGERVRPAVAAYHALAREHGIDPVHMALAWAARRPFTASAIFGATTLDQLEALLGAAEVELSDELCEAIDGVHKAHPMPF